MKKSEIYKLAQIAVLDSNRLKPDAKLEVLRELMAKEDVEVFVENEAERKTKDKTELLNSMYCKGAADGNE